MALARGARLGPYEVLEPLRSGGMGEVYRARDTRLGRLVAIKTLPEEIGADPQRMARLDLEARAISTLNHPNICALFDVGEQDGLPYLVLELVEGEPLNERLRRGPLPLDRALTHGVQLADALDQAHARGLIHRDLKPSNVMITAAGAKLLDFGLTKPVAAMATSGGDPLPTVTLSAEGQLLGTLQYMAPEQLEGKPADARTDIFALGAVLYEMVAGGRAFPGETAAVQVAAIMTKDPRPLTRVEAPLPPALDHAVRRCLAKDPADRWQSARDLRHELEWVVRGSHVTDGSQSVGRVGWTRRLPARIAGGIAAVAVLAALAGWRGSVPLPAADVPRSVIRFPVLPPDGGEFLAIGNFMAISPDGRHLAFSASRAGSSPLLWVRDLDSVASRPITGTDGAAHPFWSPDSRSVAFLTASEMKRVEIAGGPPRVICALAGLGGAWSRSGDILFTSRADGRLYRVSANGGTPTPETTLETARGETRHLWPQFLPDGRRYLYLAVSEDASHTELSQGTLGRAVREPLLIMNSSVAYVAQGYLLWRQGTQLVAQRFDPASRRFSGDVMTLAGNVWHSARTLRGVFSVSDSGVLVYQPLPTGQLAWYDRQGRSLLRLDGSTRFSSPAFSPDGRHVAVSRLDSDSGTYDTWVYESDTGRGMAFAPNPAEDFSPTWSPDGARIAFTSNRLDGITRLYAPEARGRGDDQALHSWAAREAPWAADWSPDGDLVVLDGGSGVETLSLSTGIVSSVFTVSSGFVRHARLSPDGRWLAYSSDHSGQPEVYVRAFPRGTGEIRVSSNGGVEPTWRGDGRELYYVDLHRTLMAVPVDVAPSFRFSQPIALFPTRIRPSVAPGLLGRNQYDVSPDGSRFVVSELDEPQLTVIVNWPSLLPR